MFDEKRYFPGRRTVSKWTGPLPNGRHLEITPHAWQRCMYHFGIQPREVRKFLRKEYDEQKYCSFDRLNSTYIHVNCPNCRLLVVIRELIGPTKQKYDRYLVRIVTVMPRIAEKNPFMVAQLARWQEEACGK